MIESDEPNLISETKVNKGRTDSKVRINAKEKAFKCDSCDRRFSRKGDLKLHLTIHTAGEKPLQCDYCGKKFNHKGDLNRHRKVHTGLRRKAFQM